MHLAGSTGPQYLLPVLNAELLCDAIMLSLNSLSNVALDRTVLAYR